MIKVQTEEFRKVLRELKRQLEAAEETGAEAEQTVELDQTRIGRLTRLDAIQRQAMSRETGRRRRQLMRDIDAALDRIERGEFGKCRECGRPIDPRRLKIDPTARLCIECAQSRE